LTDARIVWGWPLVAALLFIAIGPAVLAYRCWGMGVQRAGPAVAGFFSNLTPLFAALLSAAFLGEMPRRTTRGVCADRGRNRGVIAALRPVRGQSEGCTGRLNRSPDRRRRPAGCSAR
jgi:hypothetical protein